MAFSLEDKIRHDTLAPSLQAMFNFTDYDIFFSRILNSGKNGQVLKVDANIKTLYPDDNFHILKTVTSDAELKLMKQKPLTDLSIINNWQSITCGTSSTISSTSNLTYNTSNRTILLDMMNGSTSASISNLKNNMVHQLFAKFKFDNKTANGSFGIIICASQISGQWHDISAVYDGTNIQIILDNYFSTSNKKVLVSRTTKPHTWGSSSSDFCYMKVKQEYGRVIVQVSAVNEKIRNYSINYELPYLIGVTSLTKDQFSVLTILLRNKIKDDRYIGFGTTNIRNYIYPITGLTDENDIIYNLTADEMYLPEGNTWITQYFDDSISERSFIFNKYTNTLYWFKNMGNYYKLYSAPSSFNIGYPTSDDKILDGQVGKYNSSSTGLFVDANFRNLRIASNNKELAHMKSISRIISLADVFTSWDRLSIQSGNILYKGVAVAGSITGDMSSAYSKWSFDSATNSIKNNGNWNAFGAFLSLTLYYNYYLTISCIGDSDDDMIGLIVASIEDSDGVPHTLGIYAMGNSSGTEQSHMPAGCRQYPLCLVYDYDVPSTQLVLSYLDYGNSDTIDLMGIGVKGDNVTKYNHRQSQLLYIRRNERHIEGKATQAGSTTYNQFISYTLPYTYSEAKTLHPTMTIDQWNILDQMMSGYSKVGFCTKSNNCTFNIIDQQEVFEVNDIFAIHTDEVYSFDSTSSSWYVNGKCSDIIPARSFLYNSAITQLWYYYGAKNFTRIEAE